MYKIKVRRRKILKYISLQQHSMVKNNVKRNNKKIERKGKEEYAVKGRITNL